ncbi:hypothetical protein [Oryza sativa Japonica Group]|uniref:DUF7769 domain-containing protein n=2 Tax=Oryza TaxID=4527 RepID=Q5Z8R2_ORYSJ|nr:hypothetical protein [Oryza sativa Japonica Group]BAD53852.1 hypothetical protein [Oryza sativa Japonica Group]
MAAIAFDLNEPPPPELDLNETIDWMSSLDDCHESPAHKLDYDGDEEGRGNEDEENGDGGEDVAGGDEQDDQAGLEAQVHAGDEHAEGVLMQDLSLGENLRKRRYYSDELKIAIYLVLLAKADPPVLHRGVSKQVALKFGVPLRLVQHVWQNGKEKGCVDGVVNKLFKNVGRKRIEIDLEAIRDVPSGERATLRRLADALGVKKTTLHNRLKEVKFRWR